MILVFLERLVACAFLFEDNFPENTLYYKCINIIAGVFLFFFGNYLMNCMSSDLVVFQKPQVIHSFKEALNWIKAGHELEILFPPPIPESDYFKESLHGTIEYELYEHRSRLMDDHHQSHEAGSMGLAFKLRDMKVIAIARDYLCETMMGAAFYHLASDFPLPGFESTKVFMNRDETTHGLSNGFIMSKFASEHTKAVVKQL